MGSWPSGFLSSGLAGAGPTHLQAQVAMRASSPPQSLSLWYPIMENQMEKKMENEMETWVI